MEETQQLGNLIASNWQALLLISLLIIFVLPELIRKISFLKEWFGFETKEEKRFKAIEAVQKQLDAENKKLKNEIAQSERRCIAKLEETETKFDKREHSHWEESKMIKEQYDSRISNVTDKLDIILEKLDRQDQLDLKKLRHSIVRAGEESIEKGKITIRALKSLEEMYEEYSTNYHANSYVTTLMDKVRILPVIGKLNEHGEDIE